jgi:hypothetical protein
MTTMLLYVLYWCPETKAYVEFEQTRAPHPTIAGLTIATSIRKTGRQWKKLRDAERANFEANNTAHLARLSA